MRTLATFLALAGVLLQVLGANGGSLRGAPSFPYGDRDNPPKDTQSFRPDIRSETVIFLNPSVKDLPIDYCLEYSDLQSTERRGIGCGQQAANKFCKEQGYGTSTGFICMYYSHRATYVLGMNDINPASDKTLGLGFHTFFSNITCAA